MQTRNPASSIGYLPAIFIDVQAVNDEIWVMFVSYDGFG